MMAGWHLSVQIYQLRARVGIGDGDGAINSQAAITSIQALLLSIRPAFCPMTDDAASSSQACSPSYLTSSCSVHDMPERIYLRNCGTVDWRGKRKPLLQLVAQMFSVALISLHLL